MATEPVVSRAGQNAACSSTIGHITFASMHEHSVQATVWQNFNGATLPITHLKSELTQMLNTSMMHHHVKK